MSSLHTKLRKVKTDETVWVNARYSSLFRNLKAKGENAFDENTSVSLIGLDKVQRDIRKIREWPIDTGIAARVATAAR